MALMVINDELRIRKEGVKTVRANNEVGTARKEQTERGKEEKREERMMVKRGKGETRD